MGEKRIEKGIKAMSVILRIILLTVSVLTAIWILRKIRKNRVKQEDAMFWICFAIMLAALGIFPQISFTMARLLRIQAPVNFVFLSIIAILIYKLFTLSIKVSFLESKIEIMAAELAIRCKDIEDNMEKMNEIKNAN